MASSRPSQRMRRQGFKPAESNHIDLTVNFSEDAVQPKLVFCLVELLLKSLLHHRHQIPLQFEMLQRDVQQDDQEDPAASETEDIFGGGGGDDDDDPGNNNPVLALKRQRQRIKSRALRQRFLGKAKVFLASFESMMRHLRTEIATHSADIRRISLLLGATPATPKEVYHVVIPKGFVVSSSSSNNEQDLSDKALRRASLHLFRSMVTHEQLFTTLGKPLRPTNIYVAVEKECCSRESVVDRDPWLVPTLAMEGRQARRGGHVVSFHFHDNKRSVETPPPQPIEASLQKEMFPYESFTPVPMDICCTPYIARRSHFSAKDTPQGSSICVDMVETPCARQDPVMVHRGEQLRSNDFTVQGSVEIMRNLSLERNLQWFVSQQVLKGFCGSK